MPNTYPPLRLVPRSPDLPPPTPAAELAQAMLRRSLTRIEAGARVERTRRELRAQEREIGHRILAARSASERVRLARLRDQVRATLCDVTGPDMGGAA